MGYVANSKVCTSCNHCLATCAVTYDLWDGWHWGLSPGTGCMGFHEFNWHVMWYEVELVASRCRDKPPTGSN